MKFSKISMLGILLYAATNASAVQAAQNGPPSCARVTSPQTAITAAERRTAGQKAQPPLVDATFGFAWPDTSLNPVRTKDGLEFFASDGGCHAKCASGQAGIYGHATRTTGTLADPLGKAPPVDVSIQSNPDPAINPHFHAYSYVGGGPVYQIPGRQTGAGKLLMVYHAEMSTADSFYSLLGLAASADNGLHWTDLGEIVRPNHPFNAKAPGFDIGNPRLVLSPDGQYFYLHFSDWLAVPKTTYTLTSVARATVASVLEAAFGQGAPHAAAFAKYRNGGWTERGVGGASSDLTPNSPFAGAHAVYYDTAIRRYVMIMDDTQTISYALSPDALQWSPAVKLGKFGNDKTSANYAAAVGHEADPTLLGTNFDIYFTRSSAWPTATVQRFTMACR